MIRKLFHTAGLLIAMVQLTYAQETIIHYLSGTDKDHTVEWDFFCTGGRNSGKWTKIQVPSTWEQQGFGAYSYGQDKVKTDEQGLYKYTFQADKSWKGKKIFLVFEGSMTDTEVKINGKPAGPIHQGGYYEFRYDVTALLKYGASNLLEANVSKMSSNSSVNDAERDTDFWTLSGIFRPVYLRILPSTYIDRVAIDADADGSFRMDVYAGGLKKNQTIEAQVENASGENAGDPISVKTTGMEKITFENKFTNPALWSPEFPNLYRVVISIKENGKTLHTMTERFGFRTTELRKRDGFYVNGKKVIFRGVNHHATWPESGKTLNYAINLEDVKLIKEMNMNAVRCSHYPPDKSFLDLCDSLGLFVLDELTGWQAKYDEEVGSKLVKELVIRDVNHPSIVIWDNGNEGGWNRALDDDFALYDPQNRTVIHPWERFNGFDTKHYITYNYLATAVLYDQDIMMPTEFHHGLYDGGLGAGLEDFWNRMMHHPFWAGCFLWVFNDEGIVRTDKNGFIDTDSNHAPDGILGPHREKEGSFYTIKELWSPVDIDRRYITPEFDGRLSVENRYIYTDLSQCTFEWKLVNFPEPDEHTTSYHVMASGQPKSLSLAPGEKGWLDLGLPEDWNKNDALYLTAYDPYKKELFTWTWPIPSPLSIALRTMAINKTPDVAGASEQGNSLVIKNDGIQYFFNRSNGYLEKVINAKGIVISLSGGPVQAGVPHTLKQLNYKKENNQYIVAPVYDGESYYNVKWMFTPGQPAKLEYQYSQKGEADFMGITFQYPEEKITGMTWLGRGPYRVWKNRLRGNQFGVWHKAYNNTVTGESWEYPEFKGYHAELYWVTVENKEAPFTVYSGNEGTFFQMLKPEKPKGAYNDYTSPPFPEGNLGFLPAISAIGTKFNDPLVMGPQSQKNMMRNYTPYSGVLWFDFR